MQCKRKSCAMRSVRAVGAVSRLCSWFVWGEPLVEPYQFVGNGMCCALCPKRYVRAACGRWRWKELTNNEPIQYYCVTSFPTTPFSNTKPKAKLYQVSGGGGCP